MKALATNAVLLLTASPASAQPAAEPALPRADVQVSVGWQNLRAEPTLSRNNWINSIAFVDAAAGWYWTEHLRTQIDAGFGSTGRSYRVSEPISATRPVYQFIDTGITPATFASICSCDTGPR